MRRRISNENGKNRKRRTLVTFIQEIQREDMNSVFVYAIRIKNGYYSILSFHEKTEEKINILKELQKELKKRKSDVIILTMF